MKFLKNLKLNLNSKDISDGVTELTKTKRIRKIISVIVPIAVVAALIIAFLTGTITFEEFMGGVEDVK